jgi:hypothetical protein
LVRMFSTCDSAVRWAIMPPLTATTVQPVIRASRSLPPRPCDRVTGLTIVIQVRTATTRYKDPLRR